MLVDLAKPKVGFNVQNTSFAIALIGILAMFVVPLNKFLLDFLLCVSLTFSLVIFTTVLVIEKPLELSVFPTVLLVGTILRLALNVAATRRILTYGHFGETAAGGLIHAFGNFVMGGNFIIGIIIFALLVVINFIVITKGSGRIAEVAARFSLDALPGKQMAVDADLGAGTINEKEAQHRRKEIQEEMSFYGAMDGAAKFVRGDAVAAILIVAINIIGGILVGVMQNNMTLLDASKTYTFLTVGEGLVSQVPALILSVAAGMLVTKSSQEGSSDKQIVSQLSAYPISLSFSAAFILCTAFVPHVPKIPFILIAAILAFAGFKAVGSKSVVKAQEKEKKKEIRKEEDDFMNNLKIDPIKIEFGNNLVSFLAPDSSVFSLIKNVRSNLSKSLGFLMPSVRLVENFDLSPNQYNIYIKDILVGVGEVFKGKVLILMHEKSFDKIPGMQVKEPIHNMNAKWIDSVYQEEARDQSATLIKPETVVVTHLNTLVEKNITDLFSAGMFNKLMENVDKSSAKMYQEAVPAVVSQSFVLKVCENILKDGYSIRDLSKIIESICEVVDLKNIDKVTEHVFNSMGKYICNRLAKNSGSDSLNLLSLSNDWEDFFERALLGDENNKVLTIAPDIVDKFLNELKLALSNFSKKGKTLHLVTSSTLRVHIQKLISKSIDSVKVLSYSQLEHNFPVEILGEVEFKG